MKEQVEAILADVFKSHSDRRLDVFKVQVESADAKNVKLVGRVLTPDSLEAVRKGLPGVAVDTSAVKVLRATPGPVYTVATTLTDLHVEPSFLSELFTQVVCGTALEVLEEHADGKWVYVRQADGYMGWAYKPYLVEGAPKLDATHMVIGICGVFREPQKEIATRLFAGTLVRVVEERANWVRIQTANPAVDGWVLGAALRDVRPFPVKPNEARQDMVRNARMLIGTYYLWGGSSPFGIDCSGLAQMMHRINGYTLPRDADMQFKAGTPVEGPYQAGDLFFFHSETNKERIGHVGICTGGWDVIHSSRSKNGVYEEDMQANENMKKIFVGARIYIPR